MKQSPKRDGGSTAEWLCANRRGSFALGTADRIPRRKYHSLLTVREPGVGDSLDVLAETAEAVITPEGTRLLHGLSFGNVVHPDGLAHLTRFERRPIPRWTYELGTLRVVRSVALAQDLDAVRVRYELTGVQPGTRFGVRPLLRYRPIHKLTFKNPFLHGAVSDLGGGRYRQEPYTDLPQLEVLVRGSDFRLEQDGLWVEGVVYDWERERGYDDLEDLFSPGEWLFTANGSTLEAELWFGLQQPRADAPLVTLPPAGELPAELEQAAQSYVVQLSKGTSVIVGYPWFGEWSRDALICLPGLFLERGDVCGALDLLEAMAARRERGLIPNIPAGAWDANLDSIDASLLFVWALQQTHAHPDSAARASRIAALVEVACDIVTALADGADHRAHIDEQGSLFVHPGPWALTWMDAVVDGHPITPRHGFAVDLNALLYNDLCWLLTQVPAGSPFATRWCPIVERQPEAFRARFWLPEACYLADSHDGARPDGSLRPNQLWAVALPFSPLTEEQQRAVVAAVRDSLLTPFGLRTLAPGDPAYVPRYQGGQGERDRAYHQGTVWPWLLGIYTEAAVRVLGVAAAGVELAPVLAQLEQHLHEQGCVGQVNEVFDAEAPHAPGGTPAQAWSVAELLRAVRLLAPKTTHATSGVQCLEEARQ